MGRYINTALGPRWTNEEPLPDHERLQYPSSALHALGRIAGKVDHALAMAKEVGASPLPTPTAEDAFYLSEELASRGTEGLPHGSHIETQAVDTTTPLQRPYGRTYSTICTTVTIWPLNPMTPAAALLCGLLTCSGKLSPSVYERMVRETPGIIEGRLMGPREAMLDKQAAARAKYPRLWSA